MNTGINHFMTNCREINECLPICSKIDGKVCPQSGLKVNNYNDAVGVDSFWKKEKVLD